MEPSGDSCPFGRCRVPLRKIEARAEARVPRKARVEVSVQEQSALAPRGRDDRGLDEVARDAVVLRGLVVLVQQSHRDEEEARLRREVLVELVLDVRLLDLGLARIGGRRHRMLPLELGHESRAIVPAMLESEDDARGIRGGLAGVVRRPVVVELAVAEERGLLDVLVHLRRLARDARDVDGRGFRRCGGGRRGCRGFLGLHARDLGLERLDLVGQALDALFQLRGIGGVRGQRGEQRCDERGDQALLH